MRRFLQHDDVVTLGVQLLKRGLGLVEDVDLGRADGARDAEADDRDQECRNQPEESRGGQIVQEPAHRAGPAARVARGCA